MDKLYFKGLMAEFGDTQETLAKAMGISLSRFNAKLNERSGAAFTHTEMTFIVDRYSLNAEQAMRLFFTKKVS